MTRRARLRPDGPAGKSAAEPAAGPAAQANGAAGSLDPGDAAGSIDRTDPEGLFPERIVARPDGFHWLASDGRQEFGPFESIEAALADLQASDEEGPEPAETLAEAEAEIGIADWIDPETGGPAEGGCPPHIEDR